MNEQEPSKSKIDMLSERIEKDYKLYRDSILINSKEKLIEGSEEILTVSSIAKYLPRMVSEQQAEYLLRFKHPLYVITDEWFLGYSIVDMIENGHELQRILDYGVDIGFEDGWGYELVQATEPIRYRSFLIEVEPIYEPDDNLTAVQSCNRYVCHFFADADIERKYELDSVPVVVGREIPEFSEKLIYDFIRKYIDSDLYYYQTKRSEQIERLLADKLGKVVCLLHKTHAELELYNILRDEIGLSDDWIRAIGFVSLLPFFDRKEYANSIALWLMDEGSRDYYRESYEVSFDTINKRYGVQLPQDRELLEEIVSHMNPDIVDDVQTEHGFKIKFNVQARPIDTYLESSLCPSEDTLP